MPNDVSEVDAEFANLISEGIKHIGAVELAGAWQVSTSTIIHWGAGHAQPLPRTKEEVSNWLKARLERK